MASRVRGSGVPPPHHAHHDYSSHNDDDDDDDDEEQEGLEYEDDDVDAVLDKEPKSPTKMGRDEVLASLGYRPDKVWQGSGNLLDRSDLCHRCGKKVYPVEKVDVGVLYHRGCFRCRVCSIILTLRSFHKAADVKSSKSKEVYCKTHVPQLTHANLDKDALEIRQALESQKQIKRKEHEHEPFSYDPSALEFEHMRQLRNQKQRKLKRHSSLRSYKDFEQHGVFEAQSALEAVHRQEEDELYRQMYEDRRQQLGQLQRDIEAEKQRTVKDLIAWFEKKGVGAQERQVGLRKIEQFYKQKREERTQLLLQKLAAEEQAAVARMIEKHSQEMLQLIATKDQEAENTLRKQKASHQTAGENQGTDHPPDIEIDVDVLPGGQFIVGPPRYRSHENSLEDVLQAVEKEKPVAARTEPHDGTEGYDSTAHPMGTDEQLQGIAGQFYEEEEEEEGEDKNRDEEPSDKYADRRPQQEEEEEEEEEGPEKAQGSADWWEGEDEEEEREQLASEMRRVQERALAKLRMQGKYGYGSRDEEDRDDNHKKTHHHKQDHKDSPRSHRRRHKDKPHSKSGVDASPSRADVGSGEKSAFHAVKPSHKAHTPRSGQLDKSSECSPRLSRSHKHHETPHKVDTSREGEGEEDVTIYLQPDEVPPVQPPKHKKSKLYKTAEVFRELDEQAIKEAQRDHSTFTDLVRHLSMRCQSDLQRVRAIFRWVTVKDLNRMKFDGPVDPDSPIGLLRGIKLGKESYHNLFKRLCSYAGLHCEIIEGYSKGAGYRPGARFKGDYFRNQWTAVWVEGAWRFINCNWGARHVKGPKDDLLTYKCDEFYFLTDPEDHIYQHFPDDPQWQMLKEPITMDDFIRKPVVKSPFFNNKLSFTLHQQSVVEAQDGIVDIRLLTPGLMSFAAKLKSRDRRIPADLLQDRAMVRTIGNEVVFVVNLPSPGSYYVDMFAASEWGSESMDNICSFQIRCTGVSSNAHMTFPQMGCFGRTPAFLKYGLMEKSHYDPYQAVKGEINMNFALSGDPDLKLYHGLKIWNHRDKKLLELDRHAMLKMRTDDTALFTVQCPKKGLYVFLLYGASPDTPSSDMECVFRFLIDCRSPKDHAPPLPKVSRRWRNCRLIEPMSGDLTTRTKVRFRLDSEIAEELVVSLHGKWFSLKKSEGSSLWQGEMYMGDKPGKATLYGRFDPTSDKYIPLLEYSVKEATLTDEVRQLYKYI